MAYMFVTGYCYGCKNIFSFNADFVPSIRIEGEKEPICEECMKRTNVVRVEKGLSPHPIHPQAYEPQKVA